MRSAAKVIADLFGGAAEATSADDHTRAAAIIGSDREQQPASGSANTAPGAGESRGPARIAAVL
jgi:hypothetical protein